MRIAGITSAGLLALGITMLAVATPVYAGPIGDTGSFQQTRQSGYYSGNGGEFTVYNFGNSLNLTGYTSAASNIGTMDPSFQTFCLEATEYAVSPSYFEIGSAAKAGGAGAVDGQDPISKGTAWLYSQFAVGTLAGYNYAKGNTAGVDRHESAGALQNAIWWLEGENNPPGFSTRMDNVFYAAAVNFFGGDTAARADADAGYLGVYVLNNYSNAARTTKAQDFLYRVPDGGATLALLGGALLGLGAFRRKMSL